MAPLTFAFSPANPAARTGRTHAARPRAATLALVAGALATALATLASPPVWAQPAAPVAPASMSAPADAAPAPTAPERQRQRMQQQQQQQQQQSPQMRQQRMQQRQEQRQEQRMERRQQYRAERMAAFKAQLQLTPVQESAWSDFTASMQNGPRHAQLDTQGMAGLSTPERIDRMRALRIQRAADADRRGEAVKAFYATLSAPQQHTFDTHMQQMQQRMGGKGRHGGPGSGQERGYGKGYGKGMGKAGGMDCDQPGQWRTPQPAAPAPLTPQ